MIKHKRLNIYIFFSSLILLSISCTDTLIGDKGELDEDIFLNYQSQTELELPFENEMETNIEWTINQGGRTGLENNHFSNREARYGVDFGQKVNGVGFTGDGTNNEDYYSFGERVNAPGDGKVIALMNNIDDNAVVGDFNTDQPLGNFITIDHLNGEFSFLAHFQKNSIIVALGDTVQKGQEVGKLGNSGRSTGPHLHYHMQTTPNYEEGSGNGIGLPMQFLNYFADDVFIEKGEPIKGQIVHK
ncbi:M23 family metallopeptidase [Lutibacter citreus]|uniref:M23 family metallopeptidase n=1 Tax=Lutibacter citreus TaxID=2138210 RepID=UPI000DBE9D6A|nr:M23 family metallopeptidase [Lutibacter citreus]QNK78551.1 M23 family metallopeptidase [Winogradskyella sp. PAMC22761]